MGTQKIEKAGNKQALIALIAAISCLAIYIMACVMSPVTWSPDSSRIALLITPPGDNPELGLRPDRMGGRRPRLAE